MTQDRRFAQCRLTKFETKQTQVAWIPIKYAKSKKPLTIHGDPGWYVWETYAIAGEEEVKEHERVYAHWAKIRGLRKDTKT